MGTVADDLMRGPRFLVRRPLDGEMLTAWKGREVYVALAALDRIWHYWDATIGHRWFPAVWEDDGGLYQTLLHDLTFALVRRDNSGALAAKVRSLVPDRPMDHHLAVMMDDEVREGLYADMFYARQTLEAALIGEGGSPFQNPADMLFALFDPVIDYMHRKAQLAGDTKALALGLVNVPRPPKKPLGRPRGRTWDRDDLLDVARAFIAEKDDPRLGNFLQLVGISERNWKRYTKDYGFTWTELVQGCQQSGRI